MLDIPPIKLIFEFTYYVYCYETGLSNYEIHINIVLFVDLNTHKIEEILIIILQNIPKISELI